jgi:predicted glutamine amidotransferase
MCELLGLSFNLPVRPSISFRGFRLRGDKNPDGWGIGFYPDESVQVFKEQRNAPDSQLSTFLVNYEIMQSKIFLAHVRLSSRGNPSHKNTHPFNRELNGKDYVFAHNGTLNNYKGLKTGRFKSIGQTDSEQLFCHLLNCVAERELSQWTDKEFTWLQKKLQEINALGRINCILSNGEFLMCYHDINGYRGLNYVHRQPPYTNIHLLDEDYEINLSDEKKPDQAGYIIATQPLTNESWVSFGRGELLVFKNGDIVYSSSNGPTN